MALGLKRMLEGQNLFILGKSAPNFPFLTSELCYESKKKLNLVGNMNFSCFTIKGVQKSCSQTMQFSAFQVVFQDALSVT